MPEITLAVMISEVEREIKLRGEVYPGRIARGNLRKDIADRQIRIMQAVRDTLMELRAKQNTGGNHATFEERSENQTRDDQAIR